MQHNLVSVVIPLYNRQKMLLDCLQSVYEQSWRDLEIIIVDDGSTDDTLAFARATTSDAPLPVTILTQPNAGPGVARQTGVNTSRGEFIQFLDSDDVIYSNKLKLQVEALRQNPDFDIAYGKTRNHVLGQPATQEASRLTGVQVDNLFEAMLKERIWHTVTPLYRRSLLERVGPWTSLRQFEDWEYDCRLAASGAKALFQNEWVAEQRHHDTHRLATAWIKDTDALHDIASALTLIAEHARRVSDLTSNDSIQCFADTLYYWGRECARRRLIDESKQLINLVHCFSNDRTLASLYIQLSSLVGIKNAENLFKVFSSFRKNTRTSA